MTATDLNRIKAGLRNVRPDIQTATIAEIGQWRRLLHALDQQLAMYYPNLYRPGELPTEFGGLVDRAAEAAEEVSL